MFKVEFGDYLSSVIDCPVQVLISYLDLNVDFHPKMLVWKTLPNPKSI